MEHCAECGADFSTDEWEDRHDYEDNPLKSVHGRCCRPCAIEDRLTEFSYGKKNECEDHRIG